MLTWNLWAGDNIKRETNYFGIWVISFAYKQLHFFDSEVVWARYCRNPENGIQFTYNRILLIIVGCIETKVWKHFFLFSQIWTLWTDMCAKERRILNICKGFFNSTSFYCISLINSLEKNCLIRCTLNKIVTNWL